MSAATDALGIIDITQLKKLWPSPLTDRELEQRLGFCRGSFRRVAKRAGLPPRSVARKQAFEARQRP